MKRNEDLEDLDGAGCSDRQDQAEGGDADEGIDGVGERGSRRGLSERLRRILRAEVDDDLLLEGGDVEGGFLRWLRALDLQVLGACRADERLKPLLKLNLSTGAAQDHLMAQINQHFDAAEVGMLIRCLCVPLVSVRVGKVNKIGNMLFPTNIRGNLNLMLSPLSEMRILFCGDDGCNERLVIINHNSERSEVSIEEISADRSGRSFLLKLPGDQVSYFWSSEKSKFMGSELLKKMKNLFQQRLSLSQLTGICESRLDSFASYLMTNVFSSANSMESKSGSSSNTSLSSAPSSYFLGTNNQSFSTILKPPRSRPSSSGQVGKAHPLYQGSLSPRTNTFKDGPFRNLTLRNGVREKLKRRADYSSNPLLTDTTSYATSTMPDICSSSCERLLEKAEDMHNFHSLPLGVPVSLPSALPSSSLAPLSFHHPFPDLAISSPSLFSPNYCWCPPSPSFQHVATHQSLPSFMPESMTLPPLSSFLPTAGSNLFLSTQPPCQPNDLTALDLPTLLPTSSYMSIPSSQQILSFTPFIAEPIVHIPVIEVCSTGPGYLVSAGPAITSTIPLLPKLASPLAPETESMAEKNARETLRMLMASTPSNPQLMKVTVLTSVDENISYIHGKKQGLVVAGSRGLYAGHQDVDAVASGISCLGLASSTLTDCCGDDICEDVDENPKCGDCRCKHDAKELESSKPPL